MTVAPTPAQAAVDANKQQVIAINSSSLNGNAVRGKGDTYTAVAMDNACHFYSADFISSGGFPVSGKITAPTSNITYQLTWSGTNAYDGNDCIRLVNGDATKTMELASYGAYEYIYVLATAGGPGSGNYANFTVTLTYTDGTTSVTNYKLYDWYDTTKVTNVEQIASYTRQGNNTSGTGSISGSTTAGPILHSAAIQADKTKLLKSITFKSNGKNETGSNSGLYSTIYAVTGVVDNSAPATPVATAATDVASTTFAANWKTTTGATSYVLDVATDANFSNMVSGYNNKNVGNVTSASVSVPNIGNKTYYYRVRAVNSSGQSISSNVITVNTVASLKVTKAVNAASGFTAPTKYYNAAGTEVGGFSFKFSVPSGATNGYEAQVFDSDGTASGNAFRITNGYTQTIKADQYILVYGLAANSSVSVQELTEDTSRTPKGFSLTSRTVAGEEQSGTGNTITTSVVSATGSVSEQNMLVFTNTYQPESYTIQNGTFTAKKVLTGRDWLDTDRFTIRIKAPQGTPMGTELDVTTDSDGYQVITKDITIANKDELLTCGSIEYTQPGTYYYTLNEAIPDERAQGITYSAAEYRATITISDDGKGGLYVSNASFVKGLNDDGTSAGDAPVAANSDGVYVGTFTNTFNQTEASVTGQVTKKYTNNDTGAALETGQFTFLMTAVGGYNSDTATFAHETWDTSITAPMPADATDSGTITTTNLDDGVATFPAITYTTDDKSMAYVYELTEVGGDMVGMSYDDSKYYMVVRVSALGAGIGVTREYYDADGNKLAARPDFENSYNVEPVSSDVNSNIKGTKTLVNRAWNKGETFTFTVTPDAATEAAIKAGDVTDVERTVTASAPVSGQTADFTANPVGADVMTFKKSGTYTFTVAEKHADDTETCGITYDGHKGTVTYTVKDTGRAAADGKSQLSVSVSYTDMSFTNTYNASGYFNGLKVTNTLTGRALDNEKFSFSFEGVEFNGEKPAIATPTDVYIPNGDDGAQTVLSNNDADRSMLLSGKTDQSMIGKVQAFVIRETSEEAGGYAFDTTNAGAALVLIEVMANPDTPADLYTVTRIYKGADVEALLASGVALTDEAIADLTPVQTVDSSKTGDKPQVDFTNAYTAELDYGAMSNLEIHVGLAYGENSAITDRTHSFFVRVTPVASDTVTAAESGSHLTTSPSGKTIETTEMLPATPANTFTFKLSDFKFGKFTQADAGKTFVFDTKEIVETEGVAGYTFDSDTYRTWISVTDNGDGTLSAETTVCKMAEGDTVGEQVGTPYTCSTNTKGEATTSVSFSNTYKAYPPADYTPQVVKVVSGGPSNGSTFTFNMTAADDATKALLDEGMVIDSTSGSAVSSTTKLTASTSGEIEENKSQTVSFDKLVFNKVGTYKFSIKEDVPNEGANDTSGWNYDQHAYELTITVRDSGGELTASASSSSTSGGDRFSNTYSTSTTLGRSGGFDIEKSLDGRTIREGDFTFQAEGMDADSKTKINNLIGASEGKITIQNEGPNDAGKSITNFLSGLSFTTADREKPFSFKVSEVIPEGYDAKSSPWTYDANYYVVTITPYGSTELHLKASVQKYDASGATVGDAVEYDSANGTANPVTVSFSNTYTATATWGGTSLNANVTLTGRDLAAGELAFNVYVVNTKTLGTQLVSQGTNGAANDGEKAQITLPQMEFKLTGETTRTSINLNEAVQSGYAQKTMNTDGSATYVMTFQIAQDDAQMPAGVRSVTVGDSTRTVRLVITDDGKGTLTPVVEYNTGDSTGSVEFENVCEKIKTVSAAGSTADIDGQMLSAGQNYTYSIKWVNNATETTTVGGLEVKTSTAATVTVTDALPANVEFVSADNGGICDENGTVTWTLEDQAARAYGTVSVTVRVKDNYSSSDTAALLVTNAAHIDVANGSSYDSNAVSNMLARKVASVGDGQRVLVGDQISYTIEYANAGSDPATIVITDTLPATLEFVEATDGGTNADGIVTWNLEDVAAGTTGSVTVKARVLPTAVDNTISNAASIKVGESVTDVQTTTARNTAASGTLKISKTVSSPSGVAAPDKYFSFKLTILDHDDNEVSDSELFPVTGDVSGMVRSGDVIKIKAGQSAVVSRLPEGYDYKVEEIDLPERFSADGETTCSGSIEANKQSEASFANTYTPETLTVDGADLLSVAKVIDGRAWQDNDSFGFKLSVAADSAESTPMPAAGADELTLTKAQQSGSFGSIDFTKVGTYAYTVVETSAQTDDGDNMTNSTEVYDVTVNVIDAGEGKLGYNATVKLQDADEAASNRVCTFTNVYKIALPVTITNTVTADEGFSPSKDTEFEYTVELRYADEKAEAVNGQFAGLTFTNGKATFKLKEGEQKVLSGLPYGATYTVTQTANDAYVTSVNGVEGASATGQASDEAATIAFTNYYGTDADKGGKVQATDPIIVGADVKLSGRSFLSTDAFTYELSNEDSSTAKEASLTLGGNEGKLAFDALSFSKPGTYTYKICDTDAGKTINGVKHDDATHTVTITVTDNGLGKLVHTLAYDKTDESEGTSEQPTFSNVYATSAATASLSGTMKVTETEGNSFDLEKDQFGFTITNTEKPEGCTTTFVPTTVKNEAPVAAGEKTAGFTFTDLTFTVPGTYKFTVSQDAAITKGGIQPDEAVYEVTYTVTDKLDGTMGVETSIQRVTSEGTSAADAIVFDKTYDPTSAWVSVSGSKSIENVVVGTSRVVADDEFEFVISAADDASKAFLPETTSVKNKGNAFTFDTLTFTAPGTYTYKVGETAGNDATMAYDETVYTVTVTVTDVDGVLTPEVTGIPEGGIAFTNRYTAPAVSGDAITGSVSITGRDAVADEFSVKVTDQDGNEKTLKVDSEGNFADEAPSFDALGTYTYTVSQIAGTRTGVDYDGTAFSVTYRVTEDPETHKLVVGRTITKNVDGVTTEVDAIGFANTYEPAAAYVSIAGTVDIDNGDYGTHRSAVDGEFNFSVTAADDASAKFLPEASTATNKGTAFGFGVMSFTEPGTYTYVVSQAAGADSTITYDTTTYTLTVTVTDVDGVLTPEVTGIPEGGIAFTNKYVPKTVTGQTVYGNVELSGRDATEGEFTIKVVTPDGTEIKTPINVADTFVLDAPSFDQVGTYEYVISQVPGERGGVSYDSAVYTVTYKVTEDPENHELVVSTQITKTDGKGETSKVESADFKNSYAAQGTPKADLNANVKLDGDTLGGGEFTVIVVDKDGNVVTEAKNNADGTVDLSGIELDGPGTYTFTVKQQVSDKDGVTTDAKEYTVTIVVTDDLNGGYNVEVTYDGLAEGEVPEFSNAYKPSDGGKGEDNDKTDEGGKTDNGGNADSGNAADDESKRKGQLPASGDTSIATDLLAVVGVSIAAAAFMASRRRKE